MHVTIVPREKFPLGQTVLKVNEQRELTYQFTRRYLQEQLLTVLAGTPSTVLVCDSHCDLCCVLGAGSEPGACLISTGLRGTAKPETGTGGTVQHALRSQLCGLSESGALYASQLLGPTGEARGVVHSCIVCAGRAAEELVYGADEMSTINQRRLVMARRIVQKLVVSADLHDNDELGPRTVSQPIVTGGSALMQLVPSRVRSVRWSGVGGRGLSVSGPGEHVPLVDDIEARLERQTGRSAAQNSLSPSTDFRLDAAAMQLFEYRRQIAALWTGSQTNSQTYVAGLQVTSETQAVADFHMELLLKEAYEEVKLVVARNRVALDVLVEALLANSMIR